MNKLAVLAALALSALSSSGAIIPKPSWYGDPNTTFQSYTFATSSTTAAPETVSNPYGTPGMLVTVVPYIGVGTGYQDPSNPFAINRVNGAWDLGPDGSIQFTIPVGPDVTVGFTYTVDLFVAVVYEPNLYTVPDVITTPASIVSNTDNPNFELEGFFYWGLRTTVGTIGEVPTKLVTVLVDATGANGSIVDTVEIHTRFVAVPEPAHYAIGLGLCTLLAVLAKRRRPSAH